VYNPFVKDTFKIGDLVYVKEDDTDAFELGTLIQVIPFREKNDLSFLWYTLVGTSLHYVDERNIFKLSSEHGKEKSK